MARHSARARRYDAAVRLKTPTGSPARASAPHCKMTHEGRKHLLACGTTVKRLQVYSTLRLSKDCRWAWGPVISGCDVYLLQHVCDEGHERLVAAALLQREIHGAVAAWAGQPPRAGEEELGVVVARHCKQERRWQGVRLCVGAHEVKMVVRRRRCAWHGSRGSRVRTRSVSANDSSTPSQW